MTQAKKTVKKVGEPVIEKPIVGLMKELEGLKTLNSPQAKTLVESILKELM